MEQAAIKREKVLQLGPRLTTFQRDAGLSNVNEKVFAHRWGTWMEDPKERDLRARTMLNAMSGMEGFTTVMFTNSTRLINGGHAGVHQRDQRGYER